jgi:putative peptidoglycan lipid II flippase
VPPSPVGPGSLVASRFRLDDLLDEQSGARLWRATDLTLARSVAIHVLDADDPRADAVLTAARTSATVSDGRILRVLDAVREDGVVHVVHEWGAGVSLDRTLSDEVFDARRSAWVVREVAEAITVAHRQGVAHGRLVPENVLVSDAGSIKLLGFVVDAVLHGSDRDHSEHESDVRNLGALLYACLTGRWPGSPESALPAAPLDHGRACRPRQVRPGVPRDLDSLCDRILNPDPRSGRLTFETASAVAQALGGYLGDALATANLPVTEPDALLDTGELPAATSHGSTGSLEGAEDQPTMATPAPLVAPGPRTDSFRLPGLATGAPPPSAPPRSNGPSQRPGSTWIRMAALVGVVLLLLVALVVGISLDRSGPGSESDGASGGTTAGGTVHVVKPVAVSDFDPDGGPNPSENPELVPLAHDGNPSTAWETKTYFDGPVLAPYRSGVGLLLDMGREIDVHDVTVSLVGEPYDLQLLAAQSSATSPPTTTDGLTKVATRSGASGQVTLAGSEPVSTRYLVVWLTALPAGDGGFRGAISEVVVHS